MGTDKKRRGMDWARFDRADEIATGFLLWLVVGISAAYAVFVGLDWILRRQVTLVDVPLEVADGAAGTGRVVGMPQGDVLVEDVAVGEFALLMTPMLIGIAATVWGAVLLTRLLHDLGRGEPFSRTSVRRLRLLALLLVVVPIGTDLFLSIATSQILGARDASAFAFEVSFGPVVTGLLVAAVAQAFASGAKLRADVDGLV
ncbi:DUF2975 domain-containing protein [Serinicoccus marinus]|uniref:DUF2975 domain-containing protein n=1 Tax=Serinicoccus marinus TaxID=247333 RepID=UPI0024908A26|nr:DUF2975 domain-containing protein [Serinicoccus marinus]